MGTTHFQDDLQVGDDATVIDDLAVGGDLAVTGSVSAAGIALTGTFAFTGSTFDLDPTGAFTLDMDASMAITITGADMNNLFVLQAAGGEDLIACSYSAGTKDVSIGNATDNPTLQLLGTGQVTASGNIDATNGLDVTTAALTTAAGLTVSGGELALTGTNINLDPTGTFDLAMDAAQTVSVTLADNLAAAMNIADGAAAYIDIDTQTGSEVISLGNATDNPALTVLGSGQITLTGNVDCSAGLDVAGADATFTGGALTFTGTNIDLDPTGTFDLAMDSGQALSIDIAGAASTISLATDGAAQDLTIAVTGATDSSLVLSSAGTGTDAIQLTATAGGMDIAAGGAVGILSTDPMTFLLNATDALQFDNAAITGFAAAVDTAGLDVYIETTDAGGTPTVARAGGAFALKCGDGSSAADATACGAGGALSFSSGRGGVNTGGATGEAGGDGGAINFLAEEGGDTDSQGAHNAGSGATVSITAGSGGNATAGTGDGGAGGDVSLTAGAGGTTTGGSAGADGAIHLVGEVQQYKAGDASGVLLHAIGPAEGEGMETYIVDKTVSPAAVETAVFTVPAGAIIDLVQANCEAALTGGGTTATWSVGINGDVDKYGTAGLYPTQGNSLAQNSKSNWLATSVQLTSAEAVVLSGAAAGGAAAGDTALTVGSVRVVIIYRTYNPLANA